MDKLVLGFWWPVRYNCLQDVNENCEVIMHIYLAPWIVFSKKKMLAPGLNVKNEIFNRVRMQVIWPCSPYSNALSVRFLKKCLPIINLHSSSSWGLMKTNRILRTSPTCTPSHKFLWFSWTLYSNSYSLLKEYRSNWKLKTLNLKWFCRTNQNLSPCSWGWPVNPNVPWLEL